MEEVKNISDRIKDAFSGGRCPICALLQKDEFDDICDWIWQSDSRNKGSIARENLVRSGGFCNYHFWEIQRLNTIQGNASIGAELVGQLIKIMHGKQYGTLFALLGGNGNENTGHSAPSDTGCPICGDLKKKEKSYYGVLPSILQNETHRQRYKDGCGLCIPHFIKVQDYVKDLALLRFLFKTQIAQLEKIKSDAESLIQKSSPPLSWQQTEDEKKSGIRAIEKIVGRIGT